MLDWLPCFLMDSYLYGFCPVSVLLLCPLPKLPLFHAARRRCWVAVNQAFGCMKERRNIINASPVITQILSLLSTFHGLLLQQAQHRMAHHFLLAVSPWEFTAFLTISWMIYLAIYRLYFHPLAKFPGPRLAIVTYWYEFYYDIIRPGQYTFKLPGLHEKYGKLIV